MCTHDLWTRQMNFVKLHSKIHSPFPFLVSSSFSTSLPSFSSSGVLDANQVPKPSQNKSMNSKAKTMSDGLSIKWKGWCCSFLMGCNCNTVWCLELNYGGVGKGRTQKDYSIDCAAIWRRGRHKANMGGFERIGDGRQTRQRKKMGNPLKVWGKYVVCLLMA